MTWFTAYVFLSPNRVSFQKAFEALEPDDGKLSRPVLRGPDLRNGVRLLDPPTGVIRFCVWTRERSANLPQVGTPSRRIDVASLHRGSDSKNLLVDGGTQILGQQVSLYKFFPGFRGTLHRFNRDLP
jgi:hypothetical protein